LNGLAPYRFKVLPDPFFADFYMQGGWQSLESTAFVDATARVGADLLPDDALKIYGTAHVIRDNRSGLVGGFPEEVFDNVAILGVGVQAKPVVDVPLYFRAEAGWAHDLIELNRSRNRLDVRAGVEYYNEWFTDRPCNGGLRYPFRFVMVASADVFYYSRYDDAIIGSIDLRPGIRVMETETSNVDLSLVASASTNTKFDGFLQYSQLGAAITWVPNSRYDLKLVAEGSQIFFEDAEDEFNLSLYLEYSILF